MRLWLAILLVACGPAAPRARRAVAAAAASVAAPERPIAVELEPPRSASVTPVEPACREGAEEACDALDDDCDARIDEGCGYQSGALQITFAWTGGADLDLYVVDPAGYTLSYQNRASPTGAVFDREGRGACETPPATTENVYWPQRPPPGRYRVEVHHWGVCGTSGEVRGRLSIAVGGAVAAVYEVVLAPRQREIVGVFELGG